MVSSIWIPEISAITSFGFFSEKLRRIWDTVLATESLYIPVGVAKYSDREDFFIFLSFGSIFPSQAVQKPVHFTVLTIFLPLDIQKPSQKSKNMKKHIDWSISPHQPPTNTSPDRILGPSSAWAPRKKNQNLLTPQTANLKWAKTRLLHRLPDLGIPEIHPTLTDSISELMRS